MKTSTISGRPPSLRWIEYRCLELLQWLDCICFSAPTNDSWMLFWVLFVGPLRSAYSIVRRQSAKDMFFWLLAFLYDARNLWLGNVFRKTIIGSLIRNDCIIWCSWCQSWNALRVLNRCVVKKEKCYIALTQFGVFWTNVKFGNVCLKTCFKTFQQLMFSSTCIEQITETTIRLEIRGLEVAPIDNIDGDIHAVSRL